MKMRNLFFVGVLAGILVLNIASSVRAQTIDIDQAKAAGSIGEMENGLLGVITTSPELENLVTSVNQQRLEQYKQIANQQRTSVESVQMIAGQKLIQRLKPGGFYKKAGAWIRK